MSLTMSLCGTGRLCVPWRRRDALVKHSQIQKTPDRHITQGRTGLNLQEQLQPKPRVGWLKPVTQLQHLALQIGKYSGDLRFRSFWKRCNMSRLVMTVSSFQAEAPALLVSWTSGRGSLPLLWAASEHGKIIWFSSQVRGLLSPARHPTQSRNWWRI